MPKNTIVTVATSNYKEYLYAFLESAKVNLNGNYKVVIIHDNLRKDIVLKAKDIVENHFNLVFYSIYDYPDKDSFGMLLQEPEYWRLIAPYITDGANKILYIDLDTLILQDFFELFIHDLKEMTIGACIDYLKEMQVGVSNWKELQLNPHNPYFNAGVLLIDVYKYKTNGIMEKVIQIVRDNSKYLLACGKWPQNDQYGLNIALDNDWLVMPELYNYGSELEYKPCKILHFIGNGKPFSHTCKPEFRSEFFKYLEKTYH